jgi:hypothetical protein
MAEKPATNNTNDIATSWDRNPDVLERWTGFTAIPELWVLIVYLQVHSQAKG